MKVQVGRVGTTLKQLTVDDETTVEDVLSEAGLRVKDNEWISVNGEEADSDDYVSANDVIMLVRSVDGGC